MNASYHNHTTWSDGRSPVGEVVEHARVLELEEVGISDHLTLHPTRARIPWSMAPGSVDEYARDVLAAAATARESGGPVVRLGVELDWFDGRTETLREVIERQPFDYVIGSVHFHGEVEIDSGASRWRSWSPDERDAVHRAYWRQVGAMARSGLFDIAAHLDLSKKFGFRPGRPIDDLIDAALDAIAASGMVVELNTNGWYAPCREQYPSRELLERCHARSIPVTLSADAHAPPDLIRDFEAGAEMLRAVGYDRIARFEGRRVRLEEIR